MRIADRIVDIVYPRRCPVCDDAVTGPGHFICEECADSFTGVEDPYCMKCGSPLKDSGTVMCRDCVRRDHDFVSGRAAFLYDDLLKESVYRFKYGGRAEYADYYADILAKNLEPYIKSCGVDAIIPIPLHPGRLRKRGYNQAGLLAAGLSRHFDIPLRNDILSRPVKTGAQKSLGAGQRQNNLKKAFKIDSDVVKLKNTLLVDDIYTTGATMDAAAGCLKAAGVRNVYYVVLGIANVD